MNYANIAGGLLATIGTSTNLVVNGLLTAAKEKPFGFLEPAYVGLPLGILVILWMVITYRWLPDNSDTFLCDGRDRSQDMVSAFELSPGSKYVGTKVNAVLSAAGLQRRDLLKIRRRSEVLQPTMAKRASRSAAWRAVFREFLTGAEVPDRYTLLSSDAASGFDRCYVGSQQITEIADPSAEEIAQAGDTYLVSVRQETIFDVVSFAKQHLLVSSVPAVKLMCTKCEFLRVVIGVHSPLVHTTVHGGSELIEKLYSAGLVAVHLDPISRPTETSETVRQDTAAKAEMGLRPDVFLVGDRLLLLAPVGTELPKADFVEITRVGSLKPTPSLYDFVPLILFIAGVVWASMDDTAMVRVSVLLFVFCILGGWIKAEDVRHIMDWDILILIGASISLGTAVSNSGLAGALSTMVRAAGLGPQGALFLLTLVVVVLNEVVTNNAAASLGLPLAIALTKELKLKSCRPFAMAVLLGGSAAFACPIGYATHMMVMKPGNYRFWDFVKFGTVLDILYIVGITILVPWAFPFQPL